MNQKELDISELKIIPGGILQQRKLVIRFTGSEVNPVLVNCFRRISKLYIPTYAFYKDAIDITSLKSIFNRDMIRFRFMQLTPQNIDVPVLSLEQKYYQNVKWGDVNRIKHPKDDLDINIHLSYKNENREEEYVNVTTDHMKFYLNGKEQPNPYKNNPCLLIQLRPKEEIILSAKAVLGVGLGTGPKKLFGELWSASGNSYAKVNSSNDIELTIESKGQLSEYDILHRSAKIALLKLDNIEKIIDKKYQTEKFKQQNRVVIILEDEDESVCNLINHYLQEQDEVTMSSSIRINPNIYSIKMSILTKSESPLKVLQIAIDKTRNIIKNIEKIFKKYK
jgi:DNA-directed RNA polymerase subunit L